MRCPKCKGYGNETYWDENGILVIKINNTCDYCLGKGYVSRQKGEAYINAINQIKEKRYCRRVQNETCKHYLSDE